MATRYAATRPLTARRGRGEADTCARAPIWDSTGVSARRGLPGAAAWACALAAAFTAVSAAASADAFADAFTSHDGRPVRLLNDREF